MNLIMHAIMKQIITLFLFTLCGLWSFLSAQSTDQNYILTRNYQTADGTSYLDQIQYFDGLGRQVETVQKAQSLKGATWVDLVNLTEYDVMGCDYKHWLPAPATGSSGAFVNPTDFTALANTQYTSSEKPYTTTEYEASPLNRVTGQYGAGNSWYAATKKVTSAYLTNGANEVARFYVNSNNQLQRDAVGYAANTLYKTVVADEDGKTSTEYKDKLGQIVMKQSSTDAVNTYYVYDDFGHLRYVLPPLAADVLPAGVIADNTAALQHYGYLYKYDERGNNVVKRLPGCDSICMVYDKANRMVLSQDGNQRVKHQWTVTKYDVQGRIAYMGFFPNSNSRVQYKTIADALIVTESYDVGNTSTSCVAGYTCNYFPECSSFIIPLIVNYYDDYSFTSLVTGGNALNWTNQPTGYDTQYGSAKGLLTGVRTYVADYSRSYSVTALYYDYRGLVVQSRNKNLTDGYDIVYNAYSFTGKPMKTYKTHGINGASATVSEQYGYTYDNAERPLGIAYSLNGGATVTLADNTGGYDELGRLVTKKRHNGIDTETFSYNIRNWTTQISSGNFRENLYYNTLPTSATGTPCYNGNIAYQVTGNTVTSQTMYSYRYTYDNLNRLTNATGYAYTTQQGPTWGHDEIFTYDKMGNITSLTRNLLWGLTSDNLTLHYNGNQLTYVDDAAYSRNSYTIKEYQNKSTATSNEFAYDANGNMIKDLDRNIVTIRYNILNLPEYIQFKNGNVIKNLYDASGQKFRSDYYTYISSTLVSLSDGQIMDPASSAPTNYTYSGTAYLGNVEYNIAKTATTVSGMTTYRDAYTLSRLYNPEGYAENPVNPNYYYYRKDHLGNNREVWLANTNTTVQQTQYYPSGLPWETGLNPSQQQRKYNEKEFLEMHGWDSYDYGARIMYPAIGGGFMTPDPHAEKYYSVSPYIYCLNNPVKFIDPDGRDIVITGALSQEALQQLQAKVGNSIELSLNDKGNVTYCSNSDKLRGDAKRIAGMINDNSVVVNLVTTDGEKTSTGDLLIGGAFMGNTVTKDANGNVKITANQEVNPNVLGSADDQTKTPGKMIMHEVTEAYAGAQISKNVGAGVGPATQADAADPSSVYSRAHSSATSQSTVQRTLYDVDGKITNDINQAVRVEWSVSESGKSKVIQTYP